MVDNTRVYQTYSFVQHKLSIPEHADKSWYHTTDISVPYWPTSFHCSKSYCTWYNGNHQKHDLPLDTEFLKSIQKNIILFTIIRPLSAIAHFHSCCQNKQWYRTVRHYSIPFLQKRLNKTTKLAQVLYTLTQNCNIILTAGISKGHSQV